MEGTWRTCHCIIVIDPSETLDKRTFSSIRIPIKDYPLFSNEDPQEVLESYIVDCLATGVTPVAYSYDELQETALDV